MSKTAHIAWVLLSAGNIAVAGDASSYVGQHGREIKALSAQETQDYLEGKGMGFAKAAELNHFPGPLHVLQWADKLQLSPEQKSRTEQVRVVMQRDATALGRAVVDKERELDRSFASAAIDAETLRLLVSEIGRLQAQTRAVHLQAHLEQRSILTPAQIAVYDALRGYTGDAASSHSAGPRGR
jgi:Spy/CpxP family protein refolding chaperone